MIQLHIVIFFRCVPNFSLKYRKNLGHVPEVASNEVVTLCMRQSK